MIKVQLLQIKYLPLQVVSNIERKETCHGENRRHRQSSKVKDGQERQMGARMSGIMAEAYHPSGRDEPLFMGVASPDRN